MTGKEYSPYQLASLEDLLYLHPTVLLLTCSSSTGVSRDAVGSGFISHTGFCFPIILVSLLKYSPFILGLRIRQDQESPSGMKMIHCSAIHSVLGLAIA